MCLIGGEPPTALYSDQTIGKKEPEEHMTIYNHYCSVIVDGKLDVMTFPNPEKDPEAASKAIARAKFLREKADHRTAYPVEIKEILG